MVEKIAVYGAGGFARETAWLVQSCNEELKQYEVVCFADDNEALYGTIINGIPVMSIEDTFFQYPGAKIVTAVGVPKTRQILVDKAASVGFGFATIIHPRVERSGWIDIGLGTVICAGNILTVNIALGQHVQINLDCTIGHDVKMDDFTTLAPGVHVSGWVHFGKRVYVGTGAVIINGSKENPLFIGDDAVIGAAGCVTKSVPANTTVVGVPAKALVRG